MRYPILLFFCVMLFSCKKDFVQPQLSPSTPFALDTDYRQRFLGDYLVSRFEQDHLSTGDSSFTITDTVSVVYDTIYAYNIMIEYHHHPSYNHNEQLIQNSSNPSHLTYSMISALSNWDYGYTFDALPTRSFYTHNFSYLVWQQPWSRYVTESGAGI